MKKAHQLFEVFNEESNSGVALKNKALKKLIFRLLDTIDSASITEISKELNISVPKTTSLVNELIEDGLIKDYGKVDSTGGRKASMYGLVSDACFFLGVDVKKYYINIGLLDFKKHLGTQKNRIPFKLENTPESLKQLITIIKSFIGDLPVKKEKILSIGINLSGRINNTSGYSYSFFHFQEEPLSAIIQKAIGIRTYLENDSRAMAFGEFCCGEISTEKNVLFVNVDYGIGLGILVDGKVYYGKSGFSGEFGHIPFFNNEIICHCGKKGCLETEASGSSLIRNFKEKIKQGYSSSLIKKNKNVEDITLTDIIQAANHEDVLCIELLAEVGENIGRGLAVLINVFNPELIILGGTLSETGDYLRLPARSAINKYSLSLVNTDTQLKLSKLGEKAGILGACLIARNKVLAVL
ncbi:MAG: ROK family protein [Sediminibacterium sp.]|nr:ROK family protein [Sediminibacterium sp.]MBX9780328.1 ROK family protein [Chitinophagaceae bacterium]